MGKITKQFLSLVIGSLLVWLAVVAVFKDKVAWPGSEDEPDQEVPGEIDFENVIFTDGVYTGRARGHNGELVLEVSVEGGVIVRIEIISHSETDGLSEPAFEQVPASILETQSVDVDTVSGATVSSRAIMNAVKDALTQSIQE